MRPQDLKTKFFLDSGFPEETTNMLNILGFIDGQTTNPSLVAKKILSENPGIKLSKEELNTEYKKIVQEIRKIMPTGSISIEVYADLDTPPSDMLKDALEMNTWISDAHIKLPVTRHGLLVAKELVTKGINVNITLVFSEEQAAAVHTATLGAKKGQVFLSPFLGRLDDKGQNGMDLVKNILSLYKEWDSHVEILGASIRNVNHLYGLINLGCDIITAPGNIYSEWKDQGAKIMDPEFKYNFEGETIKRAMVEKFSNFESYVLGHDLTTAGLLKFANDWNNLLK
jgi:transaldolase